MENTKNFVSRRKLCAACLHPIPEGEETQIRDGGLSFHEHCITEYPNNYFVKREKRVAENEEQER